MLMLRPLDKHYIFHFIYKNEGFFIAQLYLSNSVVELFIQQVRFLFFTFFNILQFHRFLIL
jgi:hypothetical protein